MTCLRFTFQKKEHLFKKYLYYFIRNFKNIKTKEEVTSELSSESLKEISDHPQIEYINQSLPYSNTLGLKSYSFSFTDSKNIFGIFDIEFMYEQLANLRIQLFFEQIGNIDNYLENIKTFIEEMASIDLNNQYLPAELYKYSTQFKDDLVVGIRKPSINSISVVIHEDQGGTP